VTDSTVASNTALKTGGGIYSGGDVSFDTASLTLVGTTVSGNAAGGSSAQGAGGACSRLVRSATSPPRSRPAHG
jgi:predicted outer membrane repeat protein